MLENFQGDSWGSIPPLRMLSLLPHDLCHGQRSSRWLPAHSSVLAWRIPGMGESVGLPSMGLHRVGHDWSNLAAAAADVFLELSCFFYDPTDVGNLISGSSAFSKFNLNIWKFSAHVLLNLQFSSVQFSPSAMSNSLRPDERQRARPPCPSPTPGVHPNPCPLSRWCHPTISSTFVPFSSCP